MPTEATVPNAGAPTNDREYQVWEHGRRQGHNEAKRVPQTTAWRRGRLEVWAIRYLIKLGWVLRTGPDGYISGLLVRGSESNV